MHALQTPHDFGHLEVALQVRLPIATSARVCLLAYASKARCHVVALPKGLTMLKRASIAWSPKPLFAPTLKKRSGRPASANSVGASSSSHRDDGQAL